MTHLAWRPIFARLRTELLLGAAVFLLSGLLLATLGVLWQRDMQAPRVVVLGAGDQLSALVTAGEARLLLASGNDPVAFANALEASRFPTTRRLDLVLVAGSGDALLAPGSIRNDGHVRFWATVAELSPSEPARAVIGAGLPILPTPRRIWLNGEVSVEIESALRETKDGPVPVWRAVVRLGETSVVILSDGAAAGLFSPVGPVNALVIAGRDPRSAWEAVSSRAVVFADGAIAGRQLRQAAAAAPTSPEWAIRVHPGEAIRLDFVAGGLALPGDAAQPLPEEAGADAETEMDASHADTDVAISHRRPRASRVRSNSARMPRRSSGSVSTSSPVSASALATSNVLA